MGDKRKDEGPSAEVVAVVNDRDTAEFLESYMGKAVTGPFHVQRGRMHDVIAYLERAATPPRLLIVDLSGLETPLSEVDRLSEVCEPSIVVIALGDRNNIMLFRELMRIGVADYITKPLMADFLEPYVREHSVSVAQTPQQARRGRVVAFTGARGGVGATTLAVTTAVRLSKVQKRRVAYVDLDLYGGVAAVQLGVAPGGLIDALKNYQRLDSLFLDRTLLRVNPRLAVMAEETPLRSDVSVRPEAIDALVGTLAEDFHYVFLDLPRRFGDAHAHVMGCARTRVIVVDRTVPALRDGARLMELTRETSGQTVVAVNDHHPGLRGLVKTDTIEKALGRAPDLEIDYDRSAAQRIDNLGEALASGSGPLAVASERLIVTLTGRSATPPNRLRRALRLFGAA
jgi:pilus assembly protein CpaE